MSLEVKRKVKEIVDQQVLFPVSRPSPRAASENPHIHANFVKTTILTRTTKEASYMRKII
jgi:hypothetical protein